MKGIVLSARAGVGHIIYTHLEGDAMKRVLGLAAILMLVGGTLALAGNGAGCGLGHTLFEGQTGLFPNILAMTTNGTSGNNTFGMSSGTSGCDQDAVVLEEVEQEVFATANLDNLSLDMARGSGQYLQSMAALLGCQTAAFGEFASLTQDNYEVLFPTLDTAAPDMLTGLKLQMAANPVLASSCSRIS
ncbi:MAG: DUF3015 family protein [SAR324 cluster bacterium]|nr:DUF3015 family protein [SAR324 cluster bacterium]